MSGMELAPSDSASGEESADSSRMSVDNSDKLENESESESESESEESDSESQMQRGDMQTPNVNDVVSSTRALTGPGGALTGPGGTLTGPGGALTGPGPGGALTGPGEALTGPGLPPPVLRRRTAVPVTRLV